MSVFPAPRRPRFARRWRDRRAFSLVETLVVCALISTLASLAAGIYVSALKSARIARAIGDLHALDADINTFFLRHNRYPTTLTEARPIVPNDPWGRPYVYTNLSQTGSRGRARKDGRLNPINADFDLYSVGKTVSATPLTAASSKDDVIRAREGAFLGRRRTSRHGRPAVDRLQAASADVSLDCSCCRDSFPAGPRHRPSGMVSAYLQRRSRTVFGSWPRIGDASLTGCSRRGWLRVIAAQPAGRSPDGAAERGGVAGSTTRPRHQVFGHVDPPSFDVTDRADWRRASPSCVCRNTRASRSCWRCRPPTPVVTRHRDGCRPWSRAPCGASTNGQ